MLDRESLRTVLLDTRYRLIAVHEISKGTQNESLAHPREIFKPAITFSAYAIVVGHNHPSGRAPAKPISVSPVNWPRPRSCSRSPCATM
jgi:DNA repair protein RadC